MNSDSEAVINIAKNEVGYLEKHNGDLRYLYSKAENAGSNNYTKYGYEMHNLYPKVMDYPAYWCDSFVDWCFMKAYGVCNAKKLLGGNFDDYTRASAQLYKNKNAWHTGSDVKAGDQIFFGNPIHHTGLVILVVDGTIVTVEGNTSSAAGVIRNGGCVATKRYKIGDPKIAGYGRPAYDKVLKMTVEEGWRRSASGNQWWYEFKDRTYPANKWMKINHHWYYFDPSGYMLTGWVYVNDYWYFLDTTRNGPFEGAMWGQIPNGPEGALGILTVD